MGHENYTQIFQGSRKMINDNIDIMGHEYTIKYVPCWAMNILRNQFPGENQTPKYIKILYNIK